MAGLSAAGALQEGITCTTRATASTQADRTVRREFFAIFLRFAGNWRAGKFEAQADDFRYEALMFTRSTLSEPTHTQRGCPAPRIAVGGVHFRPTLGKLFGMAERITDRAKTGNGARPCAISPSSTHFMQIR